MMREYLREKLSDVQKPHFSLSHPSPEVAMTDDDFRPPWYFGGFGGDIETYGTNGLKRRIVDHVLGDNWQSGDGHGRKVMHVVSRYLDCCELPERKERLQQSRSEVATTLGVTERTIRRATGERLYGEAANLYTRKFLSDLEEIGRLWKEHADDAPSRVL